MNIHNALFGHSGMIKLRKFTEAPLSVHSSYIISAHSPLCRVSDIPKLSFRLSIELEV